MLYYNALVTELVYVLVLEAKFWEFESPLGHHIKTYLTKFGFIRDSFCYYIKCVSIWGIDVMGAWDLCKVFVTVRFCYPPPENPCQPTLRWLRNYSNDNCTVHWIYRKALFKGDLRNHKGRDAILSR